MQSHLMLLQAQRQLEFKKYEVDVMFVLIDFGYYDLWLQGLDV